MRIHILVYLLGVLSPEEARVGTDRLAGLSHDAESPQNAKHIKSGQGWGRPVGDCGCIAHDADVEHW